MQLGSEHPPPSRHPRPSPSLPPPPPPPLPLSPPLLSPSTTLPSLFRCQPRYRIHLGQRCTCFASTSKAAVRFQRLSPGNRRCSAHPRTTTETGSHPQQVQSTLSMKRLALPKHVCDRRSNVFVHMCRSVEPPSSPSPRSPPEPVCLAKDLTGTHQRPWDDKPSSLRLFHLSCHPRPPCFLSAHLRIWTCIHPTRHLPSSPFL
ncbi:hypothetical protein IE53DRAFT_156336 [Violaceomyces palustris]|uniref:Uncharacterized protein n=1 Tax=Violaceomyces palustris TaxID=1673888 RepID=A0ACD0NTW3_9BASI|nr:hypothetical protein IE53DRAFT_156336 [Violaceomyces palustris]